jgi:hypothetical protein
MVEYDSRDGIESWFSMIQEMILNYLANQKAKRCAVDEKGSFLIIAQTCCRTCQSVQISVLHR